MAANQSAPDFNRGLSSNFWWLTSAKYVHFAEACLSQKMFTNRLNIGLPL